MNVRRGFTLIELLVVIAIIAILAAILFPVFAQAKQAAKGAASLSNAKQSGLAIFMYEGDYDDRAPMSQSWDQSAPVLHFSCPVLTWSQACYPYMKNGDMLTDPLATADAIPAAFVAVPEVWKAYVPQYGMNHVVWSPVSSATYPSVGSCANPWIPAPVSATGVGRPAEVPLVVSKPSYKDEAGSWSYGAGTILANTFVDPPDCNTIVEWCFGNWGNGGNWSNAVLVGGNEANGKFTGGNTRRRALNHVVLFGDGHASAMKAGKLAVGTNFIDNPTWPGAGLLVTNASIYRWNRQ